MGQPTHAKKTRGCTRGWVILFENPPTGGFGAVNTPNTFSIPDDLFVDKTNTLLDLYSHQKDFVEQLMERVWVTFDGDWDAKYSSCPGTQLEYMSSSSSGQLSSASR
jgi:hypothetical protein